MRTVRNGECIVEEYDDVEFRELTHIVYCFMETMDRLGFEPDRYGPSIYYCITYGMAPLRKLK